MQQASLQAGKDGRIPVLNTPMIGFFSLRAALNGLRIAPLDAAAAARAPWFYADSRSLMRRDIKQPLYDFSALLDRPWSPAAPDNDGVCILRGGMGDGTWARHVRLLNRIFAGNEYLIPAAANATMPCEMAAAEGRQAVLFSDAPFTVSVAGRDEPAQRDETTGIYFAIQKAGMGGRLTIRSATQVDAAVAVLPAWMAVQQY